MYRGQMHVPLVGHLWLIQNKLIKNEIIYSDFSIDGKKQSFQSRVPRNAGRLIDVMLENVKRQLTIG